MYSQILVATDGSRIADLAVIEAARLATALDAMLRIAHVTDATYMSVEPDFVSLPEIREAHAKAGRTILANAQAVARQAGARAETRLLEIERLEQRVVDVLADEATAWPADLLVIGTHGRRGLHRLLLGSVAEGLARIATVPVLLVRDTRLESGDRAIIPR